VVKKKFPKSGFSSGNLSYYKRFFVRDLKIKLNKSAE